MKKFFVRVERAALRAVLAPELRGIERSLARAVLIRFVVGIGGSAAVSAALVEALNKALG